MANSNALRILGTQASIELGGGGGPSELFQWDQDDPRHLLLQTRLGDRVTERTPLGLIFEKELTSTDVKRHHNRLVISKRVAEEELFKCLNLDQRHAVCNEDETIAVLGHDEEGRRWDLKFKLWTQKSNGSMIYVLIGEWADMVKENRWKAGDNICVWGFPYSGVADGWQFGPDNGYDELHLVFTSAAR